MSRTDGRVLPALRDDRRGSMLITLSSNLIERESRAGAGEGFEVRLRTDEVPIGRRLLRQLVVRDHYASELERALDDLLDACRDEQRAARIRGDQQTERAFSSYGPILPALIQARSVLGKAGAWDEHDRQVRG